MFFRNVVLAFTVLALSPIVGYTQCSSTWTGSAGDSEWNNSGNWNPACVPGSTSITGTDTAIFSTTGSGTVSLDNPAISPGLNQLIFDNPTGFTIVSSDQYIQFNGANSSFLVSAGNQEISSSIQFDTTTLTISIDNSASLNLNGPSLTDQSTSSIVFDGPGLLNYFSNTTSTEMIVNGSFTQNNGTFIQENTLPLSTSDGIYISIGGDFVLNNGTNSAINSVTGVINEAANGVSASVNSFTMYSGFFNLINKATVNPSHISAIYYQINESFTMNGGKLNIINSGNIPGTFSVGSELIVYSNGGTNNFNLNSGTINLINSGDLFGGAGNVGSYIYIENDLIMSGGSISLLNNGPVQNGSNGSFIDVVNNFYLDGGLITLSNQGTASGDGSWGSVLLSNANFVMNGGLIVINPNQGSVSGPMSFGSLVYVQNDLSLNGGTLINNDGVAAATISVGSGANVSGAGVFNDPNFVNALVFTNSGTVTPGSAGIGSTNPGIMTIGGSYTQDSSGTLVTNIFDTTTYSQLQITGTAEIDGNLNIGISPGTTIHSTDLFTIVQSDLTDGLTGQFSQVNHFTADYTPHIEYFPDHIDLFFTPSAPVYIGGYTETLISSVNLINVRLGREISHLRDRVRCNQKFVSNPLAFHSSDSKELLAVNLNDPTSRHLAGCLRIFQEKRIDNHSRKTENSPAICQKKRPWNFYAGPIENFGKISAQKSQSKTNFWSAGALAGFDYAGNQLAGGLEVEYDHIVGNAQYHAGRFKTDEAHGSLYATYVPQSTPAFSLNGIVGGSYERYRISRNTSALTAEGTPHGGEFDAFLGMEYDLIRCGSFRFTPLATVQYIYLAVNDYRERNAGTLNFKVNSQTVQSLRSTLGSRFNYLWHRADSARKPLTIGTEIDFSWQREYLNHSRSLQATPLAFVQPFSTLVAPGSGRNFFLAGIDLLATYKQTYGCEASYDFEWNSLYLDHNFYVSFHVQF